MNSQTPRPDHKPKQFESFTDWFIRNYPPNCVIARPEWHAPKIYRSATFELIKQRDELAEVVRALLTGRETMDGRLLVDENSPLIDAARTALAKLK